VNCLTLVVGLAPARPAVHQDLAVSVDQEWDRPGLAGSAAPAAPAEELGMAVSGHQPPSARACS